MATYARETRVEAPFDRVREFHGTIDGLTAVTPDWMGLRVEGTYGPDGQPRAGELLEGSLVRLSIRPFGIAPRQSWTSRIVRREDTPGASTFTDVMIDGPFETWRHTHGFYADGTGTILRDRVEYEFPAGPLGPVVDGVATIPMDLLFRFRHRRTRELLE